VLRSMGHGDKLAVVDCNFPAAEVATKTTTNKCIQLSVDLPTALDAICAVLPLDFFIESPACHMAPQAGVSLPPAGQEVTEKLCATIGSHCPGVKIMPLERFSFYDEARSCFAVVQTLERRPYGNVVLTKGVVGPDGKDLKP
jgi:L-fucose mutarotase